MRRSERDRGDHDRRVENRIGRGSAAMGSPVDAVHWLVGALAEEGQQLRAGQIVFTGGLTAPFDLHPGLVVSAAATALGASCSSAATDVGLSAVSSAHSAGAADCRTSEGTRPHMSCARVPTRLCLSIKVATRSSSYSSKTNVCCLEETDRIYHGEVDQI